MIEAKKISKEYVETIRNSWLGKKEKKKTIAVKGIDISVPEGKIVGLLGVNGAGKTTTVKLLSTLLSPTSGGIEIDGFDAVKNHMKAKRMINMITGGERNLYWRLTGRENMEYFGRLYGLKGDELTQRISEVLRIVNLDEAKDVSVERYSKGMKQRLQIARGLINSPKYLFLDEPTLGLDIVIAKELRDYIASLAHVYGKGILLTTHYLQEAEELCDYIYIIHKGEIVSEGTCAALKGLFRGNKNEIKLEDVILSAIGYREINHE